MNYLFLVTAVIIVILMLLPLYRAIKGPTLFDRLISAGQIGTNGILVLVIIGFSYGRVDMFIDLAIAYALLNFIGTVAFGKYLERRHGEAQ
jgi:multicomponent Na+:H+ antiporter subunit F